MTAADIIAAHQPQDLPSTQCRCGLDLDPDDNSQSQSWDGLHAQHVLAALQAAGYEVVLLPEPRVVPSPNRALFEGCGKVTVERNAGMVLELNSGMAFRPDDARSFAAALLAAANAAEEAK